MEDPEPAHRILVLVRHAKSSWDSDVDDHDRPLSGRGRRDAVAIGQELTRRGIPDLVEFLAVRDHGSAHWARMDEKFPTAALAVLAVTGPWSEVGRSRAT